MERVQAMQSREDKDRLVMAKEKVGLTQFGRRPTTNRSQTPIETPTVAKRSHRQMMPMATQEMFGLHPTPTIMPMETFTTTTNFSGPKLKDGTNLMRRAFWKRPLELAGFNTGETGTRTGRRCTKMSSGSIPLPASTTAILET